MSADSVTPDGGAPAEPVPLLTRIADAGAGYRHSESIVQQRLYNFLMAASILLLAGAATVGAQATFRATLFMITVSLLGLFLSIVWTGLGYRERIFVDLQMEIIQDLEARLPSHLRVWGPIADLQHGRKVVFPVSKREVLLRGRERIVRSSSLLVVTPFVFGVAFVVLLCVALSHLSA